jgi:hypothetical protein
MPRGLHTPYGPSHAAKTTTTSRGKTKGGHGALTIALKNPGVYRSVSAFAPICNPVAVPWGQKAFAGYLGEESRDEWRAHDASELLTTYKGPHFPLLVDTGTADSFLERELRPQALEAAAKAAGFALTSRMQVRIGGALWGGGVVLPPDAPAPTANRTPHKTSSKLHTT